MPDLPADPTVQAQLVTAVRHHRIAPLAHVGLRDLSPDVAARLRPDRDAAIAMHLRTSGVLDRLARLLPDVPWATFKGPVLSELAHPVPGLRAIATSTSSCRQTRFATSRAASRAPAGRWLTGPRP
ncbi:nucleotidyltransferase family protein [Georgenia yuyongxinii]